MVEVDRKVYEEVIDKLLRTTDKKGIIEEFSKDVVLYCSILKDISKGKGSPNYYVLKKYTKNKWIIERAAVERAKSVLSYLSYEMAKFCYETPPDKHSGEHLSPLPVVVNESGWASIASNKFVYLPLLTFGILGLFFYISGKISLINTVKEFPVDPENTKEFFSSGPRVEGMASNSSPLKGNESVVIAWEKIWKIPEYVVVSKDELEENGYIVKKGDNLQRGLGQTPYEVAGQASLGSFMHEENSIAENKEESEVLVASLETEGSRLLGVNREKTQREITFAQESEGTEGQETSTQPEGEREPEKLPVRIEELIPSPRKWTLSSTLLYSNIDREQQLGVVELPPISNLPIPLILGEPGDSDEDFLSYLMNLRYGVTKNLEVFAFSSLFLDFRRTSFTSIDDQGVSVERDSDSEFNFGSAGIGATYQVRPEDKYPALLASASANIVENTNFGGDDYQLTFFKTFSASLVSFYTVDPIVFFLSTAYQQNFKRENDISINPGEIFSVSPQAFFVVNPFITLSGGIRFSIRGGDKVNSDTVSSTTTSLSPLFGISYGITNNLTLTLDTEYRNEANVNQASAALGFTYTFE